MCSFVPVLKWYNSTCVEPWRGLPVAWDFFRKMTVAVERTPKRNPSPKMRRTSMMTAMAVE